MVTDHCCEEGRDTYNLFHLSTCRVWDPENRGPQETANPDDIGQGEGCEGGKCQIGEKK